ncbi:hypothetical protein [Paenibacillus gansuensis]|uniref:Uncharacterized protein n=1 Tax=Paenibacillus gansuensis TaxID=306542 RepID=A0ABW5P7P6_9BACL
MVIVLAVLLVVFPVLAAWKRQWVAAGLFAAGYVVFGYYFFKDWESMEDLAAVAAFLVLVVPLYVLGLAASVITYLLGKRKKVG